MTTAKNAPAKTTANAFQLLNKEHADISYLMNDSISMVLAQALAETFETQPNDPVEFFSKFLLHQIMIRNETVKDKQDAIKVSEACSKHKVELQAEEEIERKRLEAESKVLARKKAFFETIEDSKDLNENLQELADFLQENTEATGVYIGKLVHQKKAINEDAGENDDLELELPKVVQFSHANKSHNSMINVVLTPDTAPITHSVFNFIEETVPVPTEPALDEEGNPIIVDVAPQTDDILSTFKHVYLPEVVREPKMWFKTVPRLGAFMAVPIIYNSCLSEQALEAAIADLQNVTAQNEKIQKELIQFQHEQQHKFDAAAAAGEVYVKEEKVIAEAQPEPFLSAQSKFVVCLDTMGQDREFTEEQRRFVLTVVQAFKNNWERAEIACLTADRDHRIELLHKDPQIEHETLEKMNEIIGGAIQPLLDMDVTDEEKRQLDVSQVRLNITAGLFKDGGCLQEYLTEISQLHVIKMPRIIQSLMFLMQIDRKQICEPDSNRLFWKDAKKHLKTVAVRMTEYKMLGQKNQQFKGYETINYCEKLINDYNQEEVDQYHSGFGKLFKWLSQAIALRKQDIIRRNAMARRYSENREAKIQEKYQRAQNRDLYVLEALDKFNADHQNEFDHYERYQKLQAASANGEEIDEAGQELLSQDPPVVPVFKQKELEERYDTDYPEIVIPEPVVIEYDNDWVLSEYEADGLINTYFEKKGQSITI